MHDQTRATDDALLRYLIARIDALEEQVRQLSRIRNAVTQHSRHDPVFVVFNQELEHEGEAEVERLQRNADDDAWERSGETFTIQDTFLNLDDDPVELKTAAFIVHYDGKEVPISIYCKPADWIED